MKDFFMVDKNSKRNNDSVSALSNNSMEIRLIKTVVLSLLIKTTTELKKTSNNDYRNSSSTICHQNIRGVNNRIDESVNQWGTKNPHLICLIKHHLCNTKISGVNFDSYNVGAYFL